MLVRAYCIAAVAAFLSFPANALDLSFSPTKLDGMAANFVATSGGPVGFALGTAGGAANRAATTGQPFGSALLSQGGENLSAVAAAKAATGFVAGGGVQGFVAKQAIGMGANMTGRELFNGVFPYQARALDVPVGGLQAKLVDLRSINGMKDGIQQYDLFDRSFNPDANNDQYKREPKRKASQPGYDPDRQLIGRVEDFRSDGANKDPDRQLIGRVPDGASRNSMGALGQGILDGLVGGGYTDQPRRRKGGCGSVQVDTPNPQSCFSY